MPPPLALEPSEPRRRAADRWRLVVSVGDWPRSRVILTASLPELVAAAEFSLDETGRLELAALDRGERVRVYLHREVG